MYIIGFEKPNVRMGNGRIRWVFKTTCILGAMIIQLGPAYQPLEGNMNVFEDLYQLARSHRLVQEHFSAGGVPGVGFQSRNLFSMV